MGIMECENCKIEFIGRSNRRYCSPECKTQTFLKVRKRRKEESLRAGRESMTEEERASGDSIPEFDLDSIPELDLELPTLEEETE